MTYTALARKWRPRTFSQLLGQEFVVRALSKSLNTNRVHHAYLFSGTRGVGKTSVARIFAKSLNCEQGVSANPCLQCTNCVSIEEGRFIDLIEVDGASRTRVEDTRDLLENIQYIPAIGRFKIYIIDEVHMLSQHSFNALLKTLEEPPEHVKFLLATTDPQKLPITVLSRCLQFNLKPLSEDVLLHHLVHILKDEQIDFEQPALELIARVAHGSARDALSLLDQTIAGSTDIISLHQVNQLMGYSHRDYAMQIIQCLAIGDVRNLLSISKQIATEGHCFQYVMQALLDYFHQLSIHQLVPNPNEFVRNHSNLSELVPYFSPEDVQLFYQICIKHQEDLHLAPSPSIAFDMLMLRLHIFKPTATSPSADYKERSLISAPSHKPESTTPLLTDVVITQQTLAKTAPIEWAELLSQLRLSGLTLSAAEHAEFVDMKNQKFILRIKKGHASLFSPTVLKRLEQALSSYYNDDIKVTLQISDTHNSPANIKRLAHETQLQSAETAILNDEYFQQLKQEFSGELIKTSIVPHKDGL
jgi:DNA polymerase-3 subunit gamma/tau